MKVPKAEKLKNGLYCIRLRIGGQSIAVKARTAAECRRAAAEAKLKAQRSIPVDLHSTLSQLIDGFLVSRSNVLSPATIRGYRTIQRNRFKSVMGLPVSAVRDWQAVVNEESKIVSAKTVRNAWGLVSTVLDRSGIRPRVTLPAIIREEREFLEPEQIPVFLGAVRGLPCEMDALLALHGLRRSEILAVQKSDVRGLKIAVRGAVVPGEDGKLVEKASNKTFSSTRTVPILIPRLAELIEKAPEGHIAHACPETTFRRINRVCERAGLPRVGIHGLRHTFASLCYHCGVPELEAMRLGGWSDLTTMRKIYTHLAEKDQLKSEEILSAFFQNAN